jgi:transcriptional regulator with XRE-family HTH domain
VADLARQVGEMIRQLRERHGLTQEELGRAAGLTKVSISHIERGITATNLAALERIAHQLGASPAELVGGPANRGSAVGSEAHFLRTLGPARRKVVEHFLRMDEDEVAIFAESLPPGAIGSSPGDLNSDKESG